MINVFNSRIEQARSEESAFTTAELLGNAALGVATLAVIWVGIQQQILPDFWTYVHGKIFQ